MSLTYKAALSLELVGLPNFRSAVAASWAALARAALTTLREWEPYWQLMNNNTDRRLSTSASYPWESHWVAPAFAHNLKFIVSGELVPKIFRQAFLAAMRKAKVALASGDTRVQDIFYQHLCGAIKGDDSRPVPFAIWPYCRMKKG